MSIPVFENEDELNDLIDTWHSSETSTALHEFLGFSNIKDFDNFIKEPKF